MRRDINWKTKRDDGSRYEVRVTWFAGALKIQFREHGSEKWEYDRKPTRQDLEDLRDAIARRYQRREASLKVMEAAEKMFKEAPPEEPRED
jgi:hypothetical protein